VLALTHFYCISIDINPSREEPVAPDLRK